MKQAAFLRRALALLGHDVRRETRQAQALAGSLLYLVAGVFAAQLLLRPVGPAAWLTFIGCWFFSSPSIRFREVFWGRAGACISITASVFLGWPGG